MPLHLSHVLDLDTLREPRRLALHDRFPALRSIDLYVRRRDLAAAPQHADALRPLAALADRLVGVRVFHPPYPPRADDGDYLDSIGAEFDAVLELAERLRDVTRAPAALSFHHMAEWPVEIAHEPESELRARLRDDAARGRTRVADVVARAARRGVTPLLENVAPVRNDHAFPGARLVPRFETGYCSTLALAQACAELPALRVALDVCHLALGCEARRTGALPAINQLELEDDATFDEPPPYRFALAFERLAARLDCVHLSGCAGPDKALHEGGEPGVDGDRIDPAGCLRALRAALGTRSAAVTIEVGDGHTDAGFPKLVRGVERVARLL